MIQPIKFICLSVLSLFLISCKEEKGGENLRPVSYMVLNIEETEIASDLKRFKDEKTSLWGYKDQQGKIVIEPQFRMAEEFNVHGIANALVKDKEWYKINKKGEIIVQSFYFDNGADYYSSGLSRFVENGKVGFIDEGAKIIIPAQYDWAHAFSFSEPVTVVCQGCYEESQDGEYKEMVGGKWGVINRHGQIVIPLEYDRYRTMGEKAVVTFFKGAVAYQLHVNDKQVYKLLPVKD